MKKNLLIIGIVLGWQALWGQNLSNLREKQFVSADTVQLDTLSIVPESLVVNFLNGDIVAAENYQLKADEGLLLFRANMLNKQTLKANYRVFNVSLASETPQKKKQEIKADAAKDLPPDYVAKTYKTKEPEKQLQVSGNLARGVSVGNNQNMVVNSNLNMQLAGYLNKDIQINAALSDKNIPLQPDGYSQQIQQFDQIYLRLFQDKKYLQMGDVDINSSNSYFLKFKRRILGADLGLQYHSKNKKNENYTQASAAIAKGNFKRESFLGQEGVQGPYPLRGSNNETFIIILAGSEKIYLDGMLLQRGENADYIINYNTATLTFTSKHLITKNTRIIAEFEYSDKNYNRYLVYGQQSFKTEKFSQNIQFFSESDARNQPVNQELNPAEQLILEQAGNDPLKAVVPNIDSMAFDANRVMYRLVDTLVNGQTFDSILVHSTNRELALYAAGFALVGAGNGDYVLIQSAANGRVYQWIAPQNGIRQGNYAPVQLLIAPKKQQMFVSSTKYHPNKNTQAGLEIALSNTDPNTLSSKDNSQNQGLAINSDVNHTFELTATQLQLFANYNFVQQNFKAVERFRNAEFNRDWNLNTLNSENEHLLAAGILWKKQNNRLLQFKSEWLGRQEDYQGLKNNLESQINWNNNRFNAKLSLLNSKQISNKTNFYRHNISYSRVLKQWEAGISHNMEHRISETADNQLLSGSNEFSQAEAFVRWADSSQRNLSLNYKNRLDYLPFENQLHKASEANDFSLEAQLAANKNNQLSTRATYRRLKNYTNIIPSTKKDEDNFLARIDYRLKLKKQVLNFYTYYETGTGLETKQEYAYIEVPTGQGVYVWLDYNQNNIPELDEFETAAFPEEANYLRIYTPSNEYIKVYSAKLNSSLQLNPSHIWKNKQGIKGFAARFGDVFSYRIQQKHTQEDLLERLNPFQKNINDSALLNTSFALRNQMHFNRINPKFGLDWTINSNRNKQLQINGFTQQLSFSNQLGIRWNLSKTFLLLNRTSKGNKENKSDYFAERNYNIKHIKNTLNLQWQPSQIIRFTVSYTYSNKENSAGLENGTIQNMEPSIKLSLPGKGIFDVKAAWVNTSYNADAYKPIAYEMLEGYLPGQNYTWTLGASYNITSYLRLTINYNGRKMPETSIVHTGQMNLVALF